MHTPLIVEWRSVISEDFSNPYEREQFEVTEYIQKRAFLNRAKEPKIKN